jgi:integrase
LLPKHKARELINALPLRDRLIAMIAAFCAMRPGEIFGLQRSSFRGDYFYVQGTAWCGTMQPGKAKTKGSKTFRGDSGRDSAVVERLAGNIRQ